MNYFLSNPPVYTLPGTWADLTYTGLSDLQMMMTITMMHQKKLSVFLLRSLEIA